LSGPVGGRLAFLRQYREPYRAALRRCGWWRAAPVTWSFLALTLLVSLLWLLPGGHRAAAACCAYRASDLTRWPAAVKVVGSAFLVRRPVEAAWSVAACWLVLAPLEATVGTRRMTLLWALGNLVPTVGLGLVFLAANPGVWAPLDVGTSAVVVACAAALAVWTRLLGITVLLLIGMTVDVLASPDLATAEHLMALASGAAVALALRRYTGGSADRRRNVSQRAQGADPDRPAD
jgi:hypothetical protein